MENLAVGNYAVVISAITGECAIGIITDIKSPSAVGVAWVSSGGNVENFYFDSNDILEIIVTSEVLEYHKNMKAKKERMKREEDELEKLSTGEMV